ncbi:hypothetical protein QBC33DRAFT_329549 [Phialemonium atrogriseum]|uniref:Uncharacterized protein n=1 Tax=Phialemonium atrogriseum TaxID=1093897 RepID=A0AAJ0C619_9PEZI|nr:uncharacterized protein QBC33DRAFT_329549 [Phialemonium atrogriseum]KAK1769653.1 hypothetical protein QBC33DRAFT_329549 [Phialemonium atrogriseum]
MKYSHSGCLSRLGSLFPVSLPNGETDRRAPPPENEALPAGAIRICHLGGEVGIYQATESLIFNSRTLQLFPDSGFIAKRSGSESGRTECRNTAAQRFKVKTVHPLGIFLVLAWHGRGCKYRCLEWEVCPVWIAPASVQYAISSPGRDEGRSGFLWERRKESAPSTIFPPQKASRLPTVSSIRTRGRGGHDRGRQVKLLWCKPNESEMDQRTLQ